MKKFAPLIGILLALAQAGCAAELRRMEEEKCMQEGFRPGTDSFRLCRLTLQENRR